MTSFVNPDYPKEHQGADRIEAVISAVHRLRERIAGARGLAAMLMAGAIAAMVLLADQVVGAWTEEHLLMAWAMLWVIVFATIALFAGAARAWSQRAWAALEAYRRQAAERAADERTWAVAQQDPRLMAELQLARMRAENEAQLSGLDTPHWPRSWMDHPKSMSQNQLFPAGSASTWLKINHIA